MKSCIIFVLVLEIIIGISGECFTKFRTKSTCVAQYGISMDEVWQRSHIDCARFCAETELCQSFFFFHGTQLCRQNTEKLTNFSQACFDPQLYAEKEQHYSACSSVTPPLPTTQTTNLGSTTSSTTTTTTNLGSTTSSTTTTTTTTPANFVSTTTRSTTSTTSVQGSGLPLSWQYMYYPYFFMSNPCTTDPDCGYLMNSKCTDTICQCMLGYSFDWESKSCVSSCYDYGHSYQVEKDYKLDGYDETSIPNLSEDQCLQACTDAEYFTCKSAEYDQTIMACSLSKETALTKPASVKVSSKTLLYHRDCLFV